MKTETLRPETLSNQNYKNQKKLSAPRTTHPQSLQIPSKAVTNRNEQQTPNRKSKYTEKNLSESKILDSCFVGEIRAKSTTDLEPGGSDLSFGTLIFAGRLPETATAVATSAIVGHRNSQGRERESLSLLKTENKKK